MELQFEEEDVISSNIQLEGHAHALTLFGMVASKLDLVGNGHMKQALEPVWGDVRRRMVLGLGSILLQQAAELGHEGLSRWLNALPGSKGGRVADTLC